MNALTPYTDLSPLDRANLAPGTLRHYKAAILLWVAAMQAAQVDISDPLAFHEFVADYSHGLKPSGRSNLKAALSIMLRDLINKAKLSNHSNDEIQRFLWVAEAIQDTIKVPQPKTKRKAHWLSQDQVNTVLETARANSMRDYIVMSILLGAGLRREELETLTFESLDQIPHKKQMKDVLNITGKGEKPRVVYISPSLAQSIREWKSVCKGGRVARRMQKGGKIGKSLSAYRIFAMVRQYGAIIGIPDLDPHDCRRSYGRILYENTGNIVMVQQILGHESVRTTQKYIGLNINLDIPLDAFPV